MASVTANSRMSYAFSRDNALPGSRLWAKVNPRTGTPTNSIWLCVTCSLVLASPALKSLVAYFAVTSIAVIGLYIAYVVPGVPASDATRTSGPATWHLGRWSAPIGWIAVVWVVFIVILFMLPAVRTGHRSTRSTTHPSRSWRCSSSPPCSGSCAGAIHFMRDVPEGHDTRSPDEIFSE